MNPRITLITAVYNNAHGLENAIESIAAQKYVSLEHIVIDGGSNDETFSVIQKYQNLISQFVSEKDQGIYDALNKGIQRAQGEIIGLLHSDDQFASTDTLKKIAAAFEEDPDIDGIYTDLEYVRKISQGSPVLRHWKSCDFSLELLAKGWMPPHPTLYLKKKVYDQIGSFDTRYRIASDYDFILRVFGSQKFKIKYLPFVSVQMQTGGVSNRSLKHILRKSHEDFEIMQKAGYPALWTLLNKNFSKVGQFFLRGKA